MDQASASRDILDDSASEPAKKKKRNVNFQQQTLEELKKSNKLFAEQMENMKETQKRLLDVSEETLLVERERNAILQQMATENNNFNAALLSKI